MANAQLAQFLAVAALPKPVIEKLVEYCEASGEAPLDVIADAVLLHLDALGDLMPERAGDAMVSGGAMTS
jgi:hypothetical protein